MGESKMIEEVLKGLGTLPTLPGIAELIKVKNDTLLGIDRSVQVIFI